MVFRHLSCSDSESGDLFFLSINRIATKTLVFRERYAWTLVSERKTLAFHGACNVNFLYILLNSAVQSSHGSPFDTVSLLEALGESCSISQFSRLTLPVLPAIL